MKIPLRKGKWLDEMVDLSNRAGVFEAARLVSRNVLTVLNYHRVDDITRPGFDTFAPNVTATPAEFERQMDYVQSHYQVITCEHLAAWLRDEQELPPRPAIITFDDGYYDNYANAYPILKSRNLPAVIFLTTGYIGRDKPFFWDYAAYCFTHSQKTSARLPLQETPVTWMGEVERRRVMKDWINSLKLLPETDKQRAVADLAAVLEVIVPEGAFSGLYLSWDQVREMSQNGIEMGSHTESHPILSRIPLTQVEAELELSRQKIKTEIGKPVISFAYPNGGSADYTPDVVKLVRQAGYQVAFTLAPGAARYTEIRQQPLEIRRIFLGSSDTFPRFMAKLALGRIITQ